MILRTALFSFILLLTSCFPISEKGPDTIYFNGNIYTVDPLQPGAQAIAIQDGKVVAIGGDEEITTLAGPHTVMIDLHAQFVMPGFIDGHAHLLGVGNAKKEVQLLDTHSWAEVLDRVTSFVKDKNKGDWIIGRGWHQEKWTKKPIDLVDGYPTNTSLNKLTPDHPVILRHASGHALLANERALSLAGVDATTPDPFGGRIIRDAKGIPTGVLEENAMRLVTLPYQQAMDARSDKQQERDLEETILLAQQECLSLGITSFQDAGSSRYTLDHLRKMVEQHKLDLRIWAMIIDKPSALPTVTKGLPWIDIGDSHLTVRAIKMYMDGALGSRGAWLLEPYADEPGYTGQLVTPLDSLIWVGRLALERNLQLCVHAIGDKANREFLNLCDSLWKDLGPVQDLRWRIEHAQHIDTADIPRFATLGVIPSMQAIHCISDAPFVIKRLGEDRARSGAYAWRSLLDSGARLMNGTDAPVESVNPMPNLYASITRKRMDNHESFFPEQALSRQEAIHTYTLANAYGAFQEDQLGTLSPGKWADFIILDRDLLTCPEEDIPTTVVRQTIIAGKVVYDRSKSTPQ
ncbi:MAG: amidohydrolase [Saprospiraceae bacterium]|nr:amidohydrolase [Saprospiraceae bacterium]